MGCEVSDPVQTALPCPTPFLPRSRFPIATVVLHGVAGQYFGCCSWSITIPRSKRHWPRNSENYKNTLPRAPNGVREMIKGSTCSCEAKVGSVSSTRSVSQTCRDPRKERRCPNLSGRPVWVVSWNRVQITSRRRPGFCGSRGTHSKVPEFAEPLFGSTIYILSYTRHRIGADPLEPGCCHRSQHRVAED